MANFTVKSDHGRTRNVEADRVSVDNFNNLWFHSITGQVIALFNEWNEVSKNP